MRKNKEQQSIYYITSSSSAVRLSFERAAIFLHHRIENEQLEANTSS